MIESAAPASFPPPPALCDVAVVMPTVLRPSLLAAVDSVYGQDVDGTIHLLIGVDAALGGRGVLDALAARRPAHVFVTVFDPGFSTSVRHGGLWPAYDGGALRTILSYLAHSRLVAYLDDDNWWAPFHLSALRAAIQGRAWAFSLRWFTDTDGGAVLCEDDWESVGPGAGAYNRKFGGWADPNTIMIDKMLCEPVLRGWCHPMPRDAKAMSADRRVFHALKENFPWGATGRPSVYYRPDPMDPAHPRRWARIQAKLGASR